MATMWRRNPPEMLEIVGRSLVIQLEQLIVEKQMVPIHWSREHILLFGDLGCPSPVRMRDRKSSFRFWRACSCSSCSASNCHYPDNRRYLACCCHCCIAASSMGDCHMITPHGTIWNNTVFTIKARAIATQHFHSNDNEHDSND